MWFRRAQKCAWNELVDNVWFSDEENFLLSGHVSCKNSIFWDAHPLSTVCTVLHCLKCTNWICYFQTYCIIEPFWFEDDTEHCVTINNDGYVQVLRKFCTTLGRQGLPLVPTGWCHPTYLKRIIGMFKAAFFWPNDYPQVLSVVVALFTRLKPPIFLSLGIS